jgi:hypothetical protein
MVNAMDVSENRPTGVGISDQAARTRALVKIISATTLLLAVCNRNADPCWLHTFHAPLLYSRRLALTRASAHAAISLRIQADERVDSLTGAGNSPRLIAA